MNFIKFLSTFKVFFFTGLLSGTLTFYSVSADFHFDKELIRYHLNYPFPLIRGNVLDYCFDKDGALIISSENKIGIFRGKNWEIVNHGNRSVFCVSKTGGVFIGSGHQIYSLRLDSALNYSLMEIGTLDQKLGEIRQIICMENSILVNTGKKVLKWSDNEVQEIVSGNFNTCIHSTSSRIILEVDDSYCFYSPSMGKSKYYNPGEKLKFFSDHPRGIIAFSMENKKFNLYNTSLNRIEVLAGFSEVPHSFLQLTDSAYALITSDQELCIMDQKLEIFSVNPTGIPGKYGKPVLSPCGRLWLTSPYGFDIYDLSSPLRKIKSGNLKGMILWIDVDGEDIYAGTTEGLFMNGNNYGISGIPVEYVRSTMYGLVIQADGKGFLVDAEQNVHLIAESCEKLQWDERGQAIILLKKGNIYRVELTDGKVNESILIEARENITNFSSFYGKMSYIDGRKIYYYNPINTKTEELTLPKGFKVNGILDLRQTENSIFINSHEGVFEFRISEAGKFTLTERNSLTGSIITFSENYFVNPGNNNFMVYPDELSLPGNPFPLSFYHFPGPGFYFLGDSKIIASSGEEILINDKPIISTGTLSVQLHTLKLNGSTVFQGTDFESARIYLRRALNSIAFKNNTLEFYFSPSDLFSQSCRYQYSLEHGNKTIQSDWITGNNLKLMRLKPGDYNLNIVVLNDYGVVSKPLALGFSVKRPFYLTIYAKLLYLFVASIVIFIAYRLYMIRRLNAETKEKERIKVEAFHKAEPEPKMPGEKPKFDSNINSGETKNKWDKYEMVTVLFSDIQGFTKIAESMNPERLIDELDQFFFHFDSVVDKYNIEKIKTIGDAYMAAGGIPKRNSTNPIEVVLAGLEMQQYMSQLKRTKVDIWDLRIGIHTGPVIAGRIGSKKRAYDIWGDTVNIASRMESSGEAGKVNVSGETHSLIREFFLCEYRGKIPVKYKGNLDMYFVTGLRPELSINLVGLPNRKFFIQLQNLRLTDLEDYVFERMEAEFPKAMYFHTVEYSRQVYDHAYLLARSEDLDDEDTLLVRTAALLLNIGFVEGYRNHVSESAEICRSILPEFQYSEKQINAISNLILSTRQPFEPLNTLEKILADSCMHYLGRSDFLKIYKLLFLEENELLETIDSKTWKEKQIRILKEFNYYTAAARRLCEVPFEEQIQLVENQNL